MKTKPKCLHVCCLVRCLTRIVALGPHVWASEQRFSSRKPPSKLEHSKRGKEFSSDTCAEAHNMAEVASRLKRKETWQKCPCPSKCRSAPIWQKLPYKHTRGERGRSCLNPKTCRSAQSGASATELKKMSYVAQFATERVVQKCTTNTRDCDTRAREGKLMPFLEFTVSCCKLAQ